jgi:uncharacterized membrane protein HdeD (DUF308 family)
MAFPTFAQPDDVARLARRIWYWPVVRGVLALVFGLFAILLPDITPALLVQVFGAFVVVDGLVSLLDGLRRRGTRAGSANLGVGVVAVLFGAVLLVLPRLVLGVVLVMIAVWALGFGLLQLFVASVMRSRGGTTWLWSLVSGILLVALAVVCLVSPSGSIAVMSVIVGVFACVIGAALLALGLRLRSMGRQAPAGPRRDRRVIEGEIVEE